MRLIKLMKTECDPVSCRTCSQLGDGQEDQRRSKAPLPGTHHGGSGICSVPTHRSHRDPTETRASLRWSRQAVPR